MKELMCVVAVSLLFGCALSPVHESEKPSLYVEILEMDARLFNAFNSRDLKTTKAIFDPDLEFYHDTGGVSDYAQAIENSRQLFEANTGLTRELIVDSLEIYPIAGYGAIQVGKHRFCHPDNGKMDCGVFDFVHVWKKNNDDWTVTRVISYAH